MVAQICSSLIVVAAATSARGEFMTRTIVLAFMLTAFAAGPVVGQVVTGSTGAINGTVLDNTKAVLPGVTVKIESPAMIGGARDTVTDDQGRYQFAAVPP